MILVDTSVWIDFLNGVNSEERHALHGLIEAEEAISITEIILTEILQGIRDDGYFNRVKDALLEFPIHQPKGPETYLKAAGIYRDCRKKGKTVRKTTDCIIAAICIEKSLTLLHKDTDFDRIETCANLRVFKGVRGRG
jgi:predicted nucleic acid-binding protein